MNLNEALHVVADYLELDGDELVAYAAEDTLPGYETTPEFGLPYSADGRFLYALVRALKPLRVLELGTMYGCSATHIAQALEDNGQGSLVCVDSGVHLRVPGEMIPDALRHRVTLVRMDLYEFLRHENGLFDLVFEDALHETNEVAHVWRQIPRILRPGGVMISHDAAHYVVGQLVRNGIAAAGYAADVLSIEPANCGFAVMKYAG